MTLDASGGYSAYIMIEAAHDAEVSSPAAFATAEPSVLVVDDHPGNLLAVEAVIRDLGVPIVTAASGAEALKFVLEREFAVILLDVQMPGMDGFEAASLIRQREKSRHTPIVFITAVSKSDLFIFKGYSYGAVDYILKPFAPEVLRAKVRVFVDLYRHRELVREQARRLALLNEELQRSNAELEQFASLASHDLQEPLRQATAFGKLLAEKCGSKLDETETKYLEYVVSAMARMQGLIQAVLELARLGQDVRKQEVDLDALLDGVLSDLSLPIEEAHAEVTRDELPRVTADPQLLARVLQNLIINAVKFRAERPSRIHVSARRQGTDWIVSVRDNGSGIEPARHGEIFTLFNGRGAPSRKDGSGIGLALCKRAVERQGGRIWVQSESGRGADFHFSLPSA